MELIFSALITGIVIGWCGCHLFEDDRRMTKRKQYNAKRRLKYAQRKAKKILETVVQ